MAKRKHFIASSLPYKIRKDSKEQNGNTFPCSSSGMVVMLIYPGERYCFYGTARLQCLAGELVVDNYNMPAGGYLNYDLMHQICAPYRLQRPAVFCSPTSSTEISKYKLNRLKYRLKEITPHYEHIMEVIGEKYPAVLVIDRKPSQTIKVLDQLLQDFFVPSFIRSQCQYDRTLFFKTDYEPYTEFTEKQMEEVLGKLKMMREKGTRCSIIPVGSAGTGKSTLVRHIVNANLQPDGSPIYLLDADVGQSEFTPSGCMSLWKLSLPILDIPCAHQKRNFPCSYFFGNISPADDTEKYKVIFDRLLNEFQSLSEPGSLLIINTMGWVDGLGCELLNHIFDVSRPHLALVLSPDRGTFVIPTYVKNVVNVVCKQKPFQFPLELNHNQRRPARLLPSQLRDLALVAYLSSAFPRPIISSICDAQPYCVEFNRFFMNITVCVPDDYSYVDDRYFFATLNVQIVALCSQLPDQPLRRRRVLGDETLPYISNTNPRSPLLRCHGFGIIRSVDIDKKLFYLLTPLPLSELTNITIFARGTDMLVPQLLLECQPAMNVPYLSRPALASTSGIISDLYGGLKNIRCGRREYFPSSN